MASNALGQYQGYPLTVGGIDRAGNAVYHSEVESLELEVGRLKWKLREEYPYSHE